MNATELDPDDWALLRVAALRAQGEQAKFRITWCRDVRGRYRYDVQVRRANGDIERLYRGPVESEPLELLPFTVNEAERRELRRELAELYAQTPEGSGKKLSWRSPETVEEPAAATPAETLSERARNAGRFDCSLDRCENVPFASVGGLARRSSMARPAWISEAFESDYLTGYRERARELFGEDWETAEFGWKLALKISGEE